MRQAAESMTAILSRHGVQHAFIGGFATNVLGHVRSTKDIDVEIDAESVADLQGRITRYLVEGDARFTKENLKLFFAMDHLPHRLTELLRAFEASNITLIEWEQLLWCRLGYPLVFTGVCQPAYCTGLDCQAQDSWQGLFFLVDDHELPKACAIAAGLGLETADSKRLPPAYPSESTSQCIRYAFDEPGDEHDYFGPLCPRLVLLPLLWTGIAHGDVAPLSHLDTGLPCTVWTVPFPAACAAILRIVTRESRGSPLRAELLGYLAGIIAYGMFDMSYEGDYMELLSDDEPLSNAELLEMKNAVEQIRSWTWREDEEWMRLALIQIVTGEVHYHNLPHSVI